MVAREVKAVAKPMMMLWWYLASPETIVADVTKVDALNANEHQGWEVI